MTLYLILHKVRGEPAFDIAEQMEIGGEEGWIIPTSGHRAYPYWNRALDTLINDVIHLGVPDDWPDHYQISDLPAKKGKGMGLGIDLNKIFADRWANFRRRI